MQQEEKREWGVGETQAEVLKLTLPGQRFRLNPGTPVIPQGAESITPILLRVVKFK